MNYELRIVVEKVVADSQEVVKRETIKAYAIQCPTSILELGLRHSEQISLLEKVQNALLAEQSAVIDLQLYRLPQLWEKAQEKRLHRIKFPCSLQRS